MEVARLWLARMDGDSAALDASRSAMRELGVVDPDAWTTFAAGTEA